MAQHAKAQPLKHEFDNSETTLLTLHYLRSTDVKNESYKKRPIADRMTPEASFAAPPLPFIAKMVFENI